MPLNPLAVVWSLHHQSGRFQAPRHPMARGVPALSNPASPEGPTVRRLDAANVVSLDSRFLHWQFSVRDYLHNSMKFIKILTQIFSFYTDHTE